MWNALIIAFVITAAVADVRCRRIPRLLTVSGFAAGLFAHWFHGDLFSSASAAVVGFTIGLALFSLGAIGGGDVKLITALGAILGFSPWSRAMAVAIFVACGMALVQMVRHRAVRRTFGNVLEILRSWLQHGFKAHAEINVTNPAAIRSPFGVAAAVGTMVAVFVH